MNPKEDPAYGVKCFSIAGRMVHQRERLMGMTDEERRWRSQWLKDQELSPGEPKFVPELYKDTTNIFRRCWKTPMMKLESALQGFLGKEGGIAARQYIGKTSLMIALGYLAYYHAKYSKNDWTKTKGWQVYVTDYRKYPGDPDFSIYKEKTPQEYFDQEFSKSVFNK